MDHRAVTAMVSALAPIIHEHVERGIAAACTPLQLRIAELEARELVPGERGPEGKAGKDGAPGEPGKDGKDGDRGEPGKDGRDGVDGNDGAPGEPGPAGANGKDATPEQIAAAVAEYLAANPPAAGKDGLPGEKGEPGEPGVPGRDGADGKDGAPGRDGQPGVPGRDGKDGRDGVDGKDGQDGMGFDDLTVEHDGERTMTLRLVRGEKTKEFSVELPAVIDRGVWRAGAYKAGDGVTWGGSFFIAQRETSAKPETSDDWRLAIKRGRDGKDGKDGKAGPQGQKGDRGEPGPRGYGG